MYRKAADIMHNVSPKYQPFEKFEYAFTDILMIQHNKSAKAK